MIFAFLGLLFAFYFYKKETTAVKGIILLCVRILVVILRDINLPSKDITEHLFSSSYNRTIV